MKAVLGLLPWAIALVIAGVAIWFLLEHDIALGAWLLAAFLAGHGLVHVMFLVPRPGDAAASAGGVDWPFDLARTWPVTSAGVDPGVVRIAAAVLIGVVVVGFVLAGLATVGLLVPAGWWPGLVAVSAGASIVLLALAFAPGLLLGLAIDALLLGLVFTGAWTPAPA